MTLVSVLVAAYKPTYLESALRSALGQTHPELEIVVVDDSPGSAVADIVHGLDDRRIVYLRNETNQGPALSYERAIAVAAGPLMGLLNDDDVWEPTLAARLSEALLASPEAVVAFADHWVITDDGRDLEASDACSQEWKRDRLAPGLHRPFRRLAVLDKSIPLAVAALFRRSAVQGTPIPPEVGGAYDLYLSYVLSREGAGAVYVADRLAGWRTHAASLTGDPSCERAEEGAAALEAATEDPRMAELEPELRMAYGNALWSVATRNLRAGRRRRAGLAALGAARRGNAKAWLLLPALIVPRRVVGNVGNVIRW